MRKPPARLDAGALWEYALKTLAARAHSIGELRQKLERRAARSADVDATLARLKDYGYLNDQKFAESFAGAQLDNRKHGRSRVERDLRSRRVAPAVAARAVQKVYTSVDEEALIDDYVRRKYRLADRDALFQNEKDLAAAYRRLLRAGFASGPIVRALKKFAANPDLLDGFEPPDESAHQEEDA
jgi:regulatory protein